MPSAMSAAAAAAAASESASSTTPATPSSCSSMQESPGTPSQKRKRAVRPPIDIDAKIKDLAKDIEAAQKLLRETKTSQRNERRKKKRLMAKASTLSSADLERIAVLKRCGLYDPVGGVALCFPPLAAPAHEAVAAAPVACSQVSAAPPSAVAVPPPVPPPAEDEDEDVEEAVAE